MKTDVQLLITALTTERNSLDKAISALKMITTEKPAPVAQKVARPRRRTRTFLSPELKQAIVARMQQASHGDMRRAAASAAREFGSTPGHIYLKWHTWERDGIAATQDGVNGNRAITTTETLHAPDLVMA